MKLEQQLKEKVRMQGKAKSTADVYWHWVRSFLVYFKNSNSGKWIHPSELGKEDVEKWLSWLANRQNVSANTQNQAFSAICYLYRYVLGTPLENVSALRAKRPDFEREILDQSEVKLLFQNLSGIPLLVAKLMYGSGLRIGETGNIRIKDISFERSQILIRCSKGCKDRLVGFPKSIHDSVRCQIESARSIWKHDIERKLNGVSLPGRYGEKCPSARLDFGWWYLFPSENYSQCPFSGRLFRHHRDMGHVARAIKTASKKAGIFKRITSHCLRHSFATHSIENGVPIHTLQKLMGHNDIETTEGYLHVTKTATNAVSPLELLS